MIYFQPVDNPREGACAMQNSRWINNCGYSAAYDLLNHIYGNLKVRISNNDLTYCVHLRNEFNFWNVHGIIYTSGLLQSK